MVDRIVSIARDFSRYPAGRTRRDGEFSAERFREEVLIPALKEATNDKGRVIVVLDDVVGYSSSFLEETFGGLVRRKVFPAEWLARSVEVRAESPLYSSYKLDAESYFQDELRRSAA